MKRFDRIIFIQNGLKDGTGHWLPEGLAWSEAVRSVGMEYVLLCHSDCDPSLVAKHGMRPAIPFVPGHPAPSASGLGRLAAFIEFPQIFALALASKMPADISSRDLVFVGYSTEVELLGMAMWMRNLPVDKRPAVSFAFQDLPPEWKVNPEGMTIGGSYAFWRHAIWSLKQTLDPTKVRIFGSCPALSHMLERILRIPCKTLPCATQFRKSFAIESPEKRYDLATVGGNRSDQGVHQWLKILPTLLALRPDITVSFQMQTQKQKEALIRLFGDLYDLNHIEIGVGIYDTSQYYARMQASRLLLLCYSPERYCFRDSGVFVEANCLGIPTISHAQTSMGRRVKAGMASGSVYGSIDPQEIAGVIHQSLDRIGELEQRANVLREHWIKAHSPETSLLMLLRSFGE